ncbi:MAG: hypothetical protein IJ676_00560 [Clostridia bacterium]|nr:hypothetical protein [Clostridia bacterium]
MAKYKKCPRCEINYILIDQDYCDICKEELAGMVTNYDLDPDEVDDAELCPVCHKNFLNPGEKICEECAKAQELARSGALDSDIEEEIDESEEKEDLETPSVEDEDLELSLEELQDEEFDDLDDITEEEQEEIDSIDEDEELKELLEEDDDEEEDEEPLPEDED